MINPQQCAERIVHPQRNSDPAKELFDLLLWAAGHPNLKDSNEYDEIMGDLFKRMQEGRDSRKAYAKSRTEPAAPDNRTELQPIHSSAMESH